MFDLAAHAFSFAGGVIATLIGLGVVAVGLSSLAYRVVDKMWRS